MTRSTKVRGLAAAVALGAVLGVPGVAVAAPAPVGTPASVLFSDGFESGTLSKWSVVDGSFFVQAWHLHGHHGVVADDDGVGNRARAIAGFRSAADVRYRAAVYLFADSTFGISTLMSLRNSAGASVASVLRLDNGRVGVRDDVSGTQFASATPLVGDAWQTIEIRAALRGNRTAVEVRRNGVRIAALSIDVRNHTPFDSIQLGNGTPGRFFAYGFDDVNVTGA